MAPLLVYFIIPDFKNRKFGKWVLEWDFQKPPKKEVILAWKIRAYIRLFLMSAKGEKMGVQRADFQHEKKIGSMTG